MRQLRAIASNQCDPNMEVRRIDVKERSDFGESDCRLARLAPPQGIARAVVKRANAEAVKSLLVDL